MKNIKDLLVFLGIGYVIVSLWTFFETIMMGQAVQTKVDSLVAMILTFSLYINLRFVESNMEKKKLKGDSLINGKC